MYPKVFPAWCIDCREWNTCCSACTGPWSRVAWQVEIAAQVVAFMSRGSTAWTGYWLSSSLTLHSLLCMYKSHRIPFLNQCWAVSKIFLLFVVYIYFCAYIQWMFMHTILDTLISYVGCLCCLGQWVSRFC